MNQRRAWLLIGGGGGLAAAALGGLIWLQKGRIEDGRAALATLRDQIASSRKVIEGTGTLEREVIVLRELSETMREILPDTDDVNNLVRTFQSFSDDSKVRISGVKKKNETSREKSDFDKVAYTLSLEADAFQFMDFLHRAESHSRFIRVPSFKIDAMRRDAFDKTGVAQHKIQTDLETYVYEPKNDAPPVRIEGYERKRDLLMGEITRRRQALTLSTYEYRGPRGRRDPWIDPRVPVVGDGASALTVQEQMEIVQELVDRTAGAIQKWKDVEGAENVVVEMMARAELEEHLVRIEEELRRLQSEGSIRYLPSERRLQNEVAQPILRLREELLVAAGRGPTVDMLREILKSLRRHRERAEYALVLETYAGIEGQLGLVEVDPLRKPLVEEMRRIAWEGKTVLDFEKIKIDVTGLAIIEGRPPVAVINGRSVGEGDLLGNELVVHAIRSGEIEFLFRGVILALSL